MLLRTIDPTNGLCNGTRLIVDKVIEGNVLRAIVAGNPTKVALIPRIKLISNNHSFLFQWFRRQFPVRLAFAMTINKSQGQTLRRVGIHLLTKPVFCHGKFYVAVSRVAHPSEPYFFSWFLAEILPAMQATRKPSSKPYNNRDRHIYQLTLNKKTLAIHISENM